MRELYTTEEGAYPNKKNKNTESKFFGDGWSVEQIGQQYFLEYISAAHGGSLNKLAISKECYDDAREGKLSLQEILFKYVK